MNSYYKNLKSGLDILNDANINALKSIVKSSKRIHIIGNGGSNAIASHISVDYTKWLKIPTSAFTDSSMLTAYANDYGIQNAYVEYLKSFCERDHLVILISSSGNSENIVSCIKHCEDNNIKYALLTGFEIQNKSISTAGLNCVLNIWVNSKSYGIVEMVHECFLHSIVDN